MPISMTAIRMSYAMKSRWYDPVEPYDAPFLINKHRVRPMADVLEETSKYLKKLKNNLK